MEDRNVIEDLSLAGEEVATSQPAATELEVAKAAASLEVDAKSEVLDWSGISIAQRETVGKSAKRIHEHLDSARRSMFAIGNELLAVKKILGHGRFGPWLEINFHMHERTAQRWMAAADRFKGKSDTVSVLPETVIQKLAAPSVSESLRETIVREIQAGAVPTKRDVEGRIAKEKKEARRREEENKQQQAEERDRLEGERLWHDKAQRLKATGKSEAEIAAEKKKWEMGIAKTDRTKVKRQEINQRKEESAQKAREDWVRESEISKKSAKEAVLILRRRLGPDFEKFRKVMAVIRVGDFQAALEDVPAVATPATTKESVVSNSTE
jgi:hypothetical protein